MASVRPRCPRLVLTGLAAVAMAFAASARAGGPEDGERGLTALQSGDYEMAVKLFTRALEDRRMIRVDRALAHLSRGKALLALHETARAEADFREAIALKPNDADAIAALADAQKPAASVSTAVAPPDASEQHGPAGDPWGLLASMAGRYYWYEAPGDDPNAAWLHLEWTPDGQAMTESLQSRKNRLLVGRFQIEPRSRKIIGAVVVKRQALYQTLDVGESAMTQYGFEQAAPVKSVSRLQADGSIDVNDAVYRAGAWQAYRHFRLVEVSRDDLVARGLLSAK